MKWIEYRDKFYYTSKLHDYDDNYIEGCLTYAKFLYNQNLPIIYDHKHFSLLVGYNIVYLTKVSNSQHAFYRLFKIPKKNNKLRTIYEPLPNLKKIQKWILENILNKIKPSPFSKGFRKGYSIKDNAKFHRKQKKVLTVDIKDYFGAINYDKVYAFYRNIGYSKQVSTMLSNICTLDNSLPQGSPTSPMLSNLITKRLDNRIGGFARINNIRYTRYADDLTFSGDFDEGMIIKFIKNVLKDYDLKLNENKTRVRLQSQQQEVTGIVVNEKLQVSRKYRRELRKNMFFIMKYGLESHLKHIGVKDKLSYVYHLIGTTNFILEINQSDSEAKEYYSILINLLHEFNNNKE